MAFHAFALHGHRRVRVLVLLGLAFLLLLGAQPLAQMSFTLLGNVHYWLSPAYSSPYVTADDLLQATTPTAGGTIIRYVSTVPVAFQFWTGSTGNGSPQNFPLTQGEGYSIIPVANESVTLQGSHVPAQVPQAQQALPAIPAAGIPLGGTVPGGLNALHDYLMALPWTTTMTEAEDLRLAVLQAAFVLRCDQRPANPPAFFFWTGFSGNDPIKKNFPIDPHHSYLVRSLVTSSGVVLP